MQLGSSTLLHSLYALANRSLQQDFHTSACALKGGPRAKKKPFAGKGPPRLARSPARKRLVSNLRPSGRMGTYEVAPRDRPRSTNEGPRRGREYGRDIAARIGKAPSHGFREAPSSSGAREFGRENTPHRGGASLAEARSQASSRGENRFPREEAPRGGRQTSDYPARRPVSSRGENRFLREDAPRGGRQTSDYPTRRPVSSRGENRFPREDAPRGDRQTSDYPTRRPVSPRGGNRFDREHAPHSGRMASDELKRSPVAPLIGREYERKDLPRRGADLSDDSRFKPKFGHKASGDRTPRDHNDGLYHARPDRPRISKAPTTTPLPEEFETPFIEPLKTLPKWFTSPPLMEGLFQSVTDVLGADARPSPIQSLSLKHLFTPPSHIRAAGESDESDMPLTPPSWSQYLLASETGSGKSIAYLLPMIQYLKLTEHSPAPLPPSAPSPLHKPLSLNPRGLILAPTHELSRQLSSFAKALLHRIRLRVLCTSRANTASSARGKSSTARQLKRELDDTDFGMTDGAHAGVRGGKPVDVLVGTPMKVLEMARGWGWDRKGKIEEQWDDARKERARTWIPGPPEARLASVEWVVVDEADVLFDPDFQESTRLLLADIARARGYTHPSFSSLEVAHGTPPLTPVPPSEPLAYPFHLLLTSATIPSSLATYLSTNHPTLTRLASPNLHHLPSTLKTEYHAWTSGNKNADIEKRIKRVWAEDTSTHTKAKSKILIFCNKSSKVDDLGLYLTEKGIPNVALTSSGQARHRGSNRHLAGFLKTADESPSPASASPSDPHVMITTSLLSRGLDFSPQIKHVFIVDEPRNMIDFLHRAGRSGRAGHEGKVVVFGRMKGRGAGNAREVKRKVGALTH